MRYDNRNTFDVIVIGVGGMGAATCHELARRGQRVLGLEQFPLVHDQGSSHGESRIIRKAYFEHPDYVPLLHLAYELWHDLEQATGRELLLPTGLVLSGPPEGEAIAGARLSARQHGIELEDLNAIDARKRFPGICFPSEHDVVYEPGAGTLLVDECVRSHVDEALRHGANLIGNQPVLEWTSDGDTVRVRTANREYVARTLVITAGPWASECLANVRLRLTVLRKFVGWFPVQSGEYSAASGTPTYLFETENGAFYGFPSFDGVTVKVAEHSGGQVTVDPNKVDRECHPSDVQRLFDFLQECLPRVEPKLVKHSVCLYTMTSDRHFVVDMHPTWSNVVFAAGFSGHGFKFSPVIGHALADLAETGATSLPIQFLSLTRPGLLER